MNQARSVHDALFAEPRSIWDVGVRLFRDALVGDDDEETNEEDSPSKARLARAAAAAARAESD